MATNDARARLMEAAAAINVAVQILRPHVALFADYEREERVMESIGPILDPTLYRKGERRAVASLMGPLFKHADRFVALFDEQAANGKAALEKISEKPRS